MRNLCVRLSSHADFRVLDWDSVYGFKYETLKATALSEPLVDIVEERKVMTDPSAFLTLDLYTCTTADLAFSVPFTLDVICDEFVHAFVAWFDIDFTACHTPIRFSTGPQARNTHWKQTVFYLRKDLAVNRGEQIIGTLENKPNAKNPRDLDIKISYKLLTDNPKRALAGNLEFNMC